MLVKAKRNLCSSWAVVAQAFNPSRGRWISELKASLVYKMSSRTARVTQRKKKKRKEKKSPLQPRIWSAG